MTNPTTIPRWSAVAVAFLFVTAAMASTPEAMSRRQNELLVRLSALEWKDRLTDDERALALSAAREGREGLAECALRIALVQEDEILLVQLADRNRPIGRPKRVLMKDSIMGRLVHDLDLVSKSPAERAGELVLLERKWAPEIVSSYTDRFFTRTLVGIVARSLRRKGIVPSELEGRKLDGFETLLLECARKPEHEAVDGLIERAATAPIASAPEYSAVWVLSTYGTQHLDRVLQRLAGSDRYTMYGGALLLEYVRQQVLCLTLEHRHFVLARLDGIESKGRPMTERIDGIKRPLATDDRDLPPELR